MGKFNCECSGEVRVINEATILHACHNKYASPTSYYDGLPKFRQWDRVQLNPELTNGEIKYRWFAHWD